MVIVGEHFASGNWQVQPGSEDEFITRWKAFLSESTRTAEGFGSAHLMRDADDPSHFLSFSDWADAASREAWKSSPEFERGLASCRELCSDFVGTYSSQVASI
jgi:heme-degrading monooxygenase HmoA